MRAARAGTRRALAAGVRIAVVALLVACKPPMPPAPSLPMLADPAAEAAVVAGATDASFNSRIVALRTSLGRGAIRLETRGATWSIRTATCNDEAARHTQRGCARCDLAAESDQLDGDTLDALRVAFDRYPASFLSASGIENVALCQTIEYETDVEWTPGGPHNEREVAGTVDYTERRLFIRVGSYLGPRYDGSAYLTAEDIVHHELFHLIEYVHMRSEMDDPEWRLENPLGFSYRDAAPGGERPDGFVNSYATSNEIEDRASTFQYMMSRPVDLCGIAREDARVLKKMKLIWERVAKIDGDDWLRARALCGR